MSGKVIAVVVAVAILVGLSVSLDRGPDADVATAPVELNIDDMQQFATLARGVRSGDESAPITILEFADFQCPVCGTFAGTVKTQLEAAFVESGAAKLVFYDFPLTAIHPHAFLASRAARCAEDQGMFWDYHDELFRNQPAWSLAPSPPVGRFEEYAGGLGMDQAAFRSCLRSDAHAETISATLELGARLGVRSTPTVLVSRGNGQVHEVEARPLPEMYEAIQAVVEGLQAEIRGAAAGEAIGTGAEAGGGE